MKRRLHPLFPPPLEEIEEAAYPVLSSISKANVYTVPQHYFDNVTPEIIAATKKAIYRK